MGYHLRRKDRQINDQVEITELLQKGKYAVIAMCRDNVPYVVTLSYGVDLSTNTLYFHCAMEGQKIDFIKANPEVCATIISDHGYLPGECAHKFASIIIKGRMRALETLEEKKLGMRTLLCHLEETPEKFEQKQLKEDNVYQNICILKLEIEEMTGKKGQ